MPPPVHAPTMTMGSPRTADDHRRLLIRTIVLIAISFFTLVDLFAAQSILPILAGRFDVSAAEMGAAVNASTFGMAVAGLVVAVFSRKIPRRTGICTALILLAIPTVGLAYVDELSTFAALRVMQGILMSSAFTLMIAYLSEECAEFEVAGALAAFITGNVASNLFGRIIAASLAASAGVEVTFLVFAVMNLAGAALVYVWLRGTTPLVGGLLSPRLVLDVWSRLLGNKAILAGFAIGFLILFVFVGAFTFVNAHLASAPFSLSTTQLGLIYLVFLPALLSTPFTGEAVARIGVRRALYLAIAVSVIGVLLSLTQSLAVILAGLALLGIGLFFAQAAVTAFVGRTALAEDKGMATALYLASYYAGGLFGGIFVGMAFAAADWPGASAALIAGLLIIAVLGALLSCRSLPHSKEG